MTFPRGASYLRRSDNSRDNRNLTMASKLATTDTTGNRERRTVDAVVIRFAGDSGDGMQLTGTQFTQSTALMGNDLATFPDFPAEIRAPAGTTFGVSAFQINFASYDIMTPGDEPDVLVAMNPAALKVHLKDVVKGGITIRLRAQPDVVLREGQLCVVPKGVEHSPESPEPSVVLLFEPRVLKSRGD